MEEPDAGEGQAGRGNGGGQEAGAGPDAPEPGPAARVRRLLGGRFGRLVLPAVVLQSVLVGGGYASGREVVEFGARFGALGWVSVLAIFAGFTVTSILVFELARVTGRYEYKSFIESLIGPLWPAFDLLFVAMAVLVIAVMASAAGNILEDTLGAPYVASILVILAVVGVLLYEGASVIEAFKTAGTTALYGGFLLFAGVVLAAGGANAASTLRAWDTSLAPDATALTALGSGILYVGYNLVVYPAVLFVLHRQTETRETVLAGVLSGLVMTIPFLLTYLCVLVFYPDGAVVGAEVPWLVMLEATGLGWLVALYGLVVGWTLLETSLGLVHALLDRVDADLARVEAGPLAGRDGLAPRETALLGTGILAAAALLAQVGIVDLVAKGYTTMAYGFIAVFAVPLFTVGTVRILAARGWEPPSWAPLDAGGPGSR